MIDVFSSQIIHVRMKSAFTGVRLNVMTQALHAEEGSLPQGLTIQNTYTEMHNGSKNITIIVRNSMVYPQTLKKIPEAKVVAANQVPDPQMQPGMTKVLDGAQGILPQKLTMEQRQDKLLEKLDLSGLDTWPSKLAFSPWNPASLAVLILLNMCLMSLMMPCLKNDSGRSLCHWWKRSVHTYE